MKITIQALVVTLALIAVPVWAQSPGPAREVVLKLDPSQTKAEITLPTTLHTVEGRFLLKHGTIRYEPASGKASGEIVFDATSGNTGNDSRDRKMHKEILESQRFPEIVFHPDRAEGILAISGASNLKVHGQFGIHGVDHEITIPVEINIADNHWTAKAPFEIPYLKWGMKNPSVIFLRVKDTVQIQFSSAGSLNP
jgi:polyisoprenoid-binding protein YceI